MDRLRAIDSFVRVVETGSFARAADRLDVSVSAVSRQVADLEAHLGSRLLNRSTRRLSLTETGRTFHERCVQLLADLEEAEREASEHLAVPRGTLRMTCSVAFGARHIAPAIADYSARYPQVHFDIDLSDRFVDLVDAGLDLAVRIGAVGSQSLIARRIGRSTLVCCASPAYLERVGVPASPDELPRHNCLVFAYGPREAWAFGSANGDIAEVRVAGNVLATNAEMLASLAVAGAGICYEPDFVVAPDIRAGRLVAILAQWRGPGVDIHAVYPSRRHLSAKVRSFVDYLAARFATRQEWQLDHAAQLESRRDRPPAQ